MVASMRPATSLPVALGSWDGLAESLGCSRVQGAVAGTAVWAAPVVVLVVAQAATQSRSRTPAPSPRR